MRTPIMVTRETLFLRTRRSGLYENMCPRLFSPEL